MTAGGVGIIIGAATAHAGELAWLAFVLAAVLSGAVLVMLTQLEARAVRMGLALCAAGAIAAFLLRPSDRSAAA